MSSNVAVIGLGEIGRAIASRLLDQGHDVLACDRDDAAIDTAAALGARTTTRAADCTSSEVVLVVVANDPQVRDVLEGADGLLSETSAGKAPVVVVMSTVSVQAIKDMNGACRKRGISLVDAPLSGGALRAANGTLSLMVGGADEDVRRVRPVLDDLAAQVFHLGDVGSGAMIKIVNNVICAGSVFISAEAFRLAAENGVALADLLPVLEASSGRSFLTSDLDYALGTYAGITSSHELFEHTVASMQKDLELAEGVAADSAGAYPLLTGLAEILSTLGTETFENWNKVGRPVTQPN
jgi:3-hydroxyisobutyrate dehydrogenase-like beta-hydroxyacid dehydrogenase